jgi:hypothetical protein
MRPAGAARPQMRLSQRRFLQPRQAQEQLEVEAPADHGRVGQDRGRRLVEVGGAAEDALFERERDRQAIDPSAMLCVLDERLEPALLDQRLEHLLDEERVAAGAVVQRLHEPAGQGPLQRGLEHGGQLLA